MISFLWESGGVSDDEAARAIEAWLRWDTNDDAGPKSFLESLGFYLSWRRLSRPLSDESARILLARARVLLDSEAALSRSLIERTIRHDTPSVKSFLVAAVAEETADLDLLQTCLERRRSLAKALPDALLSLTSARGSAAGVAAALLEDAGDLLRGYDEAAILALLACARYLRGDLPLVEVEALLGRSPAVASAARSYLEALDTAQARRLLAKRFAAERPIIGFDADLTGWLRSWERRFRAEMGRANGPEETFALLSDGDCPLGGRRPEVLVVRVWRDRAEFARYDGHSRRTRRFLSPRESADMRVLLRTSGADDLPAVRFPALDGSWCAEYLHLERSIGHRVSMYNGVGTPCHQVIVAAFHAMEARRPLALRYEIQDTMRDARPACPELRGRGLGPGEGRPRPGPGRLAPLGRSTPGQNCGASANRCGQA